jgi:hypothetical protein
MDNTDDRLRKAFTETTAQLEKAGLKTSWYTIPKSYGYDSLAKDRLDETFCLETHLGPSQIAGFETYGVVQVFSAAYPTLAVTLLIERSKSDGSLAEHLPIFNAENDKVFSGTLLPLMYKALNHLDPSGGERGQLVQLYNGKMSLSDLIQASGYTMHLMRTFKEAGQLSIIAVDFNDPLIRFIARASDAIAGLFISDVHQIPSTDKPSTMSVPVQNGQGSYQMLTFTTAFDQGIDLAMSYLDKHYQSRKMSV